MTFLHLGVFFSAFIWGKREEVEHSYFQTIIKEAYKKMQEFINTLYDRRQEIVFAITLLVIIYIPYKILNEVKQGSFQWNDQIAIVTGSSGGLGSSIAKKLIKRGCGGVICVDIKNNDWLEESDDSYPKAISIQCDITKPEEISKLTNKIKEQFKDKKVSILINNAGIMYGAPLLDLPQGQFEKTINVNFTSSYYLLRAFLPDMIDLGRGHIVATSSVMAYVGVSKLGDYVASKHALTGLMESLRYELDKIYRKPNIRTSIVVLGQMTTPLFAKAKMSRIGGFLMPLQDPNSIAEDIVDSIQLNKSSYIYRPYLARLAPVVQAMPQWIRDLAQRISGADEALSD